MRDVDDEFDLEFVIVGAKIPPGAIWLLVTQLISKNESTIFSLTSYYTPVLDAISNYVCLFVDRLDCMLFCELHFDMVFFLK